MPYPMATVATDKVSVKVKRARSSVACQSCKKAKSRCEPALGKARASGHCHRCAVLAIPCSFEGSQKTENQVMKHHGLPLGVPAGFGSCTNANEAEAGRSNSTRHLDPFAASALSPKDVVFVELEKCSQEHWTKSPMDLVRGLLERKAIPSLAISDDRSPNSGNFSQDCVVYLLEM
jgi:hypothetical protein